MPNPAQEQMTNINHLKAEDVVEALASEDYDSARTLLSEEFIRCRDDKDFITFVDEVGKAGSKQGLPDIYQSKEKSGVHLYLDTGTLWGDQKLLTVRDGLTPNNFEFKYSYESDREKENLLLKIGGQPPKDMRGFIAHRLADRTGRLFEENDRESAQFAIKGLLNITQRLSPLEQMETLLQGEALFRDNRRTNSSLATMIVGFADLNRDGKPHELASVRLVAKEWQKYHSTAGEWHLHETLSDVYHFKRDGLRQ